MSTVDSKTLFQELQGETEAGFATMHSEVHSSSKGIPYLRKPGVAVLARPSVQIAGLTGFLQGFDSSLHFSDYTDDPTALPDGAQLCKIAGQVCYMSFGRMRSMNAQAKRYFDNLKSSGHGSVFEHANYSLLFYGISRSVTHELIRHRSGFGYSANLVSAMLVDEHYVLWSGPNIKTTTSSIINFYNVSNVQQMNTQCLPIDC